jgi:hypothetical protein
MRILLLFFLTFSLLSISQEVPTKWQSYVKDESSDGKKLLIEKGKKKGVYDLSTQDFLIPLDKQNIIILNESNVIFLEDKKSFQLILLTKDSAVTIVSKYREFGNNQSLKLLFPRVEQRSLEGWVFNGAEWVNTTNSKSENEIESDLNSNGIIFEREASVTTVSENEIIINHFELPLVSLNQFDMATVVDSGFSRSGLYHTELEDWLIEPKYQQLYYLNDHILAFEFGDLTVDEYDYSFRLQGESHFDLYKRDADEWILKKAGIKELTDINIHEILGVDELNELSFTIYQAERNGHQGLFSIDLFIDPFLGKSSFHVVPILDVNYDFVLYQPSSDAILAIETDKQFPLKFMKLNQVGFAQIVDSAEYKIGAAKIFGQSLFMKDDTILTRDTEYVEPEYEINFGAELLNDSLIIVTDYEYNQSHVTEIDPETGDFMYDEYGEVIYQRDSASLKSGVYDLSKKDWLLPPQYKNIWPANDAYIISEVEEQNDGMSAFNEIYKIIDEDQTVLDQFNTVSEAFNQSESVELMISDFIIDSVFPGPSGLNNSYEQKYSYYFRTDNRLGLIYPGSERMDKLYTLTDTTLFIHTNTDIQLEYSCDLSFLYMKFQDTTFKTPISKGKIELKEIPALFESMQYVIWVISDMDTMTYNLEESFDDYSLKTPYHTSIEFDNGYLIINEKAQVSQFSMDSYGEIWSDGYYDLANSSIWHLQNGKVIKVSPYYGSITPVNFGYIVQTVGWTGKPIEMDGFYQFDSNGELVYENQQPSHYLLLNNDLKSLSFLDYYDFDSIEDLSFGLKIRTEKGYMFVDNNGNLITTDQWDDFILEEERLKAVKYGDPYDEFGNPLYDENGFIIEDPVKEFKYFDLPKK